MANSPMISLETGGPSSTTGPAGAADGSECAGAVAFEDEVRPHHQALYRAALRLTRQVEAAEDLVQDTLERAYRKFHRYQPGTNVRAWLLRIMRNLWINSYRRQLGAPRPASLDALDELPMYRRAAADGPHSSEVEACVVDRLGAASILAAIETLPSHARETVILADVEGAGYRAVAAALQIPLGTVMSRLFRARRQLRRALKEQARGAGYLPKAG
jgi:RNA polymerase sigma-70 factor (ECF subfamily)